MSAPTEDAGTAQASSPPWAVLWSEKEQIFRILTLEQCIYAGQRAFLGPQQVDLVLVGVEKTPAEAAQTVSLLEEARGLAWDPDRSAWIDEAKLKSCA